MSLRALIVEAEALAGEHRCATSGHEWATDGGRTCPREEDCGRSQAVYRCKQCGEYDYGEPGGPGHHDCYGDGRPCSS